jgi:hypothetical protein
MTLFCHPAPILPSNGCYSIRNAYLLDFTVCHFSVNILLLLNFISHYYTLRMHTCFAQSHLRVHEGGGLAYLAPDKLCP